MPVPVRTVQGAQSEEWGTRAGVSQAIGKGN